MQTVDALQKNELASESELFIYSDAPKNENAVAKVNEVREHIKVIDGFKKVTIIKREKNWGLAGNIIDGVTMVLKQYGRVIVLEDDLVTSPLFLKFMNEALTLFKYRRDIYSISGYTFPVRIPDYYHDELFLFYRSSSWGWATWKNRWDTIEFNTEKIELIIRDKGFRKKFKRGGEDLYQMLKMQLKGYIDSWAIRFALGLAINDAYTLYPVRSLVKNIGLDASGTHREKTSKWEISIDKEFLPKMDNINIKLDNEICIGLQHLFSINPVRKLYNYLRFN